MSNSSNSNALGPQGRAIVKSVISGDSVLLRGKPAGGPPPEKVLSLANVIAPRLGTPTSPDKEEIGAFESRERLRKLLVGKEVAFRVEYTTNTNNRDFGYLTLQPPGVDGETSVTRLLVKEGWLKMKPNDGKRQLSDEQTALQELEAASQLGHLGLWGLTKPPRIFSYAMPEDPRAFYEKYRGKAIDGSVDQIRDGSTLRVCLFLEQDGRPFHQYVTIGLTGIKAPVYRVGVSNSEDVIEPYSEEAKFFVESRLLQRDVKVLLEGVASTNNSFIGTLLHPAGNISEVLLAEGYASVVSWSIGMVTGGPAKLRAAEQSAKDKKLRIWKNYVAKPNGVGANGSHASSEFEGVVTKISSADTIHIAPVSNLDGLERKISFSSYRAPKPKEEKEAFYNLEAKELLRQRLIGKTVSVKVDYIKPAENDYPARECGTVTIQGNCIAETLISKGLGWALRHRKDDDNRASNYDALLVAEDKAQKAQKGVHSGKETTLPRIQDASETAAKAKGFLPYLQRSGFLSAIVDHVASASRFKIWIPSQNTKITLVLAGIRAPRPGRASTSAKGPAAEKPEPFGPEGLEFISRRVLQREIEISVEGADKVGGFIGNLFLTTPTGRVNVACLLLEAGFATVHDYSASQSPYSRDLYNSEKIGQDKRAGIWSVRDPIAEAAAKQAAESLAANGNDDGKPEETADVYVCEIGNEGKLCVQIIGKDLNKLETLMADFAKHHASKAVSAIKPKVNEYVSAKFTADDAWYRAKVRSITEDGRYEVVFIDYGNSEILSAAQLRPLDPTFSTSVLPAQAHEARLAFLAVPALSADMGDQAYERIRDETEGKQLKARILSRGDSASGGLQIVLVTVDGASLNEMLVSEGLATVERMVLKRFEQDGGAAGAQNGSRKALIASLIAAQEDAKKARANLWRYGDFQNDED